jgi:hypothetical protein
MRSEPQSATGQRRSCFFREVIGKGRDSEEERACHGDSWLPQSEGLYQQKAEPLWLRGGVVDGGLLAYRKGW